MEMRQNIEILNQSYCSIMKWVWLLTILFVRFNINMLPNVKIKVKQEGR